MEKSSQIGVVDCLARLQAADGQTMTEYGMVLSVVALVVVVLLLTLGARISELFVPVVGWL